MINMIKRRPVEKGSACHYSMSTYRAHVFKRRFVQRRTDMKKGLDLTLAEKVNDKEGYKGEGSDPSGKARARNVSADDNIYTDTIRALLEKNRSRVARYYCANRRCASTFWDAALGFTCPRCGSIGIISTFNADTALEPLPSKPVLGMLDSIGRLFCRKCAERFGIGDDVGLIVYHDSEPYCSETCEACRSRLNETA
jgi:hypothetical protein